MNKLSNGAAWMNGEIIPVSEARVGVTDWGITHADSVYDVVPVIDGAFFRLPLYLARFQASLASGRFDTGMTEAQVSTVLHDMVGASGPSS